MANSDTLEKLISPEQRKKDERKERLARLFQWAIIIPSVIVLALWAWGAVHWFTQPRIRNVEINNLRVTGKSELCQGEWLIIAFDTKVEGEGTLILDASTQRISPPRTVVFSNWLRFPIRGPLHEETVIAWQVPTEFPDVATGQMVEFPPGNYLRNVSLVAANRGSPSDMESAEFTVRSDCERLP